MTGHGQPVMETGASCVGMLHDQVTRDENNPVEEMLRQKTEGVEGLNVCEDSPLLIKLQNISSCADI